MDGKRGDAGVGGACEGAGDEDDEVGCEVDNPLTRAGSRELGAGDDGATGEDNVSGDGFFFFGGEMMTGCFNALFCAEWPPCAASAADGFPNPNFRIAAPPLPKIPLDSLDIGPFGANEGKSILEPKVGVPHRELDRPMSSSSSLRSRSSRSSLMPERSGKVEPPYVDRLPERTNRGSGTSAGTATIQKNQDPGHLFRRVIFQPADSMSANVSRRVRSCELNVHCIYNSMS